MPRKKAVKADTGEPSTMSKTTKEKKAPARGKRKSSDDQEPEAKKPKTLMNKTETDFHSMDFSHEAATTEGSAWNLKISTWNCDGIRAWIKKGGHKYVLHENPDVFCLQETKCSEDKLPEEARKIDGYTTYWCAGETDGYAGVGLYSKVKPLSLKCGIGDQEFDKEGRVITAEYEKFYLVNVYVPNAGRGLVNLSKRMQWDVEFRKYLKDLDSKKGVILCGDLNVAHQEIDIANPKGNKKNAGFTQEERDGFTQLLKEGFVDSFRHKHPETKAAYTFWTYMANARAKNIGWRLDYFVLSEKLLPNLCDCIIRHEVLGSDHCPVVLLLHI